MSFCRCGLRARQGSSLCAQAVSLCWCPPPPSLGYVTQTAVPVMRVKKQQSSRAPLKYDSPESFVYLCKDIAGCR